MIMKPRQIVLYGLVITALCTALLVSDLLPALVVGFFALGLGMVLSYYIALSQQRGNFIGEMDTQNRILEKIQAGVDAKASMRQLCTWSNWLVGGEDALLWLEGTGIIAETTPGDQDRWTAVAQGLDYPSQAFMLNSSQLAGESDFTWEDVLVVNDNLTDGRRLVLFLLNPGNKSVQHAVLFRLLHAARYIMEREMGSRAAIEEYKQLANLAVSATEQSEPFFNGHGCRVQYLALLLGQRLHLQDEEIKVLEYAALLHDIGKAMHPEEDPGVEAPISGDERQGEDARDHASLGASLIPDEGWWHEVREAIRYHHERYDGSGYPQGLKQYDIPLSARVIAVADVYDALTVLAPEEERLAAAAAVGAIKRATGIWFDPLVVVALEEIDLTLLEG